MAGRQDSKGGAGAGAAGAPGAGAAGAAEAGAGAQAAPAIDTTKPLPPEQRLNFSFLLEIPNDAIRDGIFEYLATHGHPGVRPAHEAVFATIEGDGSRITDMAARANLTKQSMQYLVDDLERLGYAERVDDPQDRRAKLVRLTPTGRECVLVARDAIHAMEQRFTDLLGDAKMRRLRTLLEELVEALRAPNA